MNATLVEPWAWSPRRWIWAILTFLAIEVFLFWYLSDRSRPAPVPPPSRADLYLILDPAADQKLAEILATSDPTLFALPNLHNYSGGAWLRPSAWSYQWQDWADTAPGLSLQTNLLGTAVARLLTNRTAPDLLVLEKPRAGFLELLVPNEPRPIQSVLHIEDGLATRSLLSPLALPVVPYNNILQDSVVLVAVNPAGEAVSGRLLESCGLAAADQEALRLAKSARFAPLPLEMNPSPATPPRLAFGRFVFRWCTTNLPPVKPSS